MKNNNFFYYVKKKFSMDVSSKMNELELYIDKSLYIDKHIVIDYFKIFIDNNFQFEFKKKEKIENILKILAKILISSTSENFYHISNTNEFKQLNQEVIDISNLQLYSTYSIQTISCLLNLTNNKKANLINYYLSSEHKFYKLIKFYNIKTFKNFFVKMTEYEDLPLLRDEMDVTLSIYSKYLYIINSSYRNIYDYDKLIEKYFDSLENDLVEVNFNNINERIKILETSINLIHYKKLYPNIKLISDINLAFIRQYYDKLNINNIINLFAIISSDNFILNYDLTLFTNLLCNQLNKLINIIDKMDKELVFELLFYMEKLYINDYSVSLLNLIEVKCLDTIYLKNYYNNDIVHIIENPEILIRNYSKANRIKERLINLIKLKTFKRLNPDLDLTFYANKYKSLELLYYSKQI